MMTKEERYKRDPAFARVVDMLYHAITEIPMTPTEIREAAVLASIKYELDNPRPVGAGVHIGTDGVRKIIDPLF